MHISLFLVFLCLKTHALNELQHDYTKIVNKVSDAVVNLTVRHVRHAANPFREHFFKFFNDFLPFDGEPLQRVEESTGSGVVVTKEGLLVTCAHVVSGAQTVMVHFTEGKTYEAEILSVDEKQDLAILAIKNMKQPLPFLHLGDSEALSVGEHVLAIGNAFGLGQTVTHGIISAQSRVVQKQVLIQTDAPVNPGNSGGALVNMNGEVVGIPNAIMSRTGASAGVGFCVPAKIVQAMLARHLHKKDFSWFGVYTQYPTSDIKKKFKIEHFSGIVVVEIHPSSPLTNVLKVGDLILELGGKKMLSPAYVDYVERISSVGEKISVTFIREGKHLTKEFVSQSPAQKPYPEIKTFKETKHLFFEGVSVANISPALAIERGFSTRHTGVVVLSVKKSPSFFTSFSLEKGDIIVSLNKKKIQNTKALAEVLASTPAITDLHIQRKGRDLSFSVKKNYRS